MVSAWVADFCGQGVFYPVRDRDSPQGRFGVSLGMQPMELTQPEIAYLAGVVDCRGYLGRRRSGLLELPTVSVTLKAGSPVIARLCELTGVTPIILAKSYNRTGCADHCPVPHVHVSGDYERWIVTGAKARIVLAACVPYLFGLRAQVVQVLEDSTGQPFKPASIRKMAAAGWPVSLPA